MATSGEDDMATDRDERRAPGGRAIVLHNEGTRTSHEAIHQALYVQVGGGSRPG